MSRTAVLVVAVALAAGAAAGVMVQRITESDVAVAAGPATSEAPAQEPVWSSAFETRIGPAVVIAEGLEYDNGMLALTYDVVGIGPASFEAGGLVAAAPAQAAPRSWELTAGGAVFPASVVGPSNRTIRFAVGEGFVIDEIDEIRIVDYQVLSPVRFLWDVDRDDRDWHPLGPDLRLRVADVAVQPSSTLVRVEADLDVSLVSALTVEGRGRAWQNSSRSMISRPLWTLDHRDGELPQVMPLEVRGLWWITVEGGGPVALEGIEEE